MSSHISPSLRHNAKDLPELSRQIAGKKVIYVKLRKNTNIIAKVNSWSWILLMATAAFQCFFFWSIPDVVAILCIVIAWLILSFFFMNEEMLRNYPLSVFLIIGFTATQFYFPLLFTSLEFKPVIFNLELPYEVFFHSLAALIVLVMAHYIYRYFPQQTKRRSSYLYRCGFFTPPEDLQLWLIGGLGLMANIYVFFVSTDIATQISGNPSDKAIQSLLPFAYAPYFIPVKSIFGGKETKTKKLVLLLTMWTVALFIISMARNSRGAFMIGFTSIAFAYGLGLLLQVFELPKIAFKNIAIAVSVFWVVTGPLADLGTAMVIVRSQRADITKAELIELTWNAFQDKNGIAMRRLADKNAEGNWDERYLDNIFTARFANIKFNDASLIQAEKVGEKNPEMLRYSIDYMWGALPGPILKLANPDVNKDEVYSSSFGDYIYHLAGAGSLAFGGYRTGHFAGTGMAAFGWWYLLILGLAMIPVFLLFDKLCLITGTIRYYGHTEYKMVFSVASLLTLTAIFQFLPIESVSGIIAFLIRGYFQIILLYFAIYHVSRLLSNFIHKF